MKTRGQKAEAGGWRVRSVSQSADWSPVCPSAPLLSLFRTAPNAVAVSGPSPSTNRKLQPNTNRISSVNGSNVTVTIQADGTTTSLIVNPPTGNRFLSAAQTMNPTGRIMGGRIMIRQREASPTWALVFATMILPNLILPACFLPSVLHPRGGLDPPFDLKPNRNLCKQNP